MEGVRMFLESSTIHGLVYISTTKKRLIKIFWILIVTGGFTGAGYLIYESFNDWSKNPVKTTTENMPITDITFPKVTVCPPKNTFTELNYDLKMTQKISLENETFRQLSYYLQELLYDDLHNKFMTDLQKLQDNGTFYNWYHGYSELLLHISDKYFNSDYDYKVRTSALAGTVSSQYFGSRFDFTKFDPSTSYRLWIHPPESVRDNTNVTLHLKVQWIKADDFQGERFHMGENGNGIDSYKYDPGSSFEWNQSPPITWRSRDYVSIHIERGTITKLKEIKNLQQEMMPGFKLTWFYSGQEVVPEAYYQKMDLNKAFIR